jgi:type I restriction enzyme S subunit
VKFVHSTWATVTLSDIGDIFCGQSASAAEVNSEGRGDVYITGPEQWDGRSLHLNKWTEHPKRVVPEGCIFITVKGAGVGKIFPGIAAAIGRDIYAYKPSREVDASFVQHAIQYRIGILIEEARGDIPGLSKDHLAEHEMALPPFAEQHRIVARLDILTARLDRARAELNRIPMLAKRLRQAALSQIYDRKSGIELVSLSNYCSSITDGDHQAPPRAEQGVPFITISAMNNGRIDLAKATRFVPPKYAEGLKATRKVQMGDVLYSVTGSFGIPALVRENKLFVFQRHIALLRPDPALCDPFWLNYIMAAPQVFDQARAIATGTAQLTVPLTGLRAIQIPRTQMSQQRKTVAELDATFARADHLEAEAARARALLDRLERAILAKAFKGHLVRQDPSDEPASVLLDRIRAQRASAPKTKHELRSSRRITA